LCERPADHPLQDYLGPQEHQRFQQEEVEQEGIPAAIAGLVTVPLYTASKAVGLSKGRSRASFSELAAGYQGLQDGARQVISDKMERLVNSLLRWRK